MTFLDKNEAFLLAASILISLQLLANGEFTGYVDVAFIAYVPVLENATTGTVLTYINDTNPRGNNKVLSITYTKHDRAFIIEKVVGEPRWKVILNRTLDYDWGVKIAKSIGVPFKASGGLGILCADMVIQIVIIDVNDNSPLFENQLYNADVKEDESTGSTVCTNIRATDIDNGTNGDVRYKLEPVTQGGGGTEHDTKFMINAVTGDLTLNGSLDYESKTFYHFIVIASDQGTPSLSSTSDLFVTVKDVQDSPPVFTNLPYAKSVDENTALGHTVLTVKAVDQDQAIPNQVGYSITHTDCPGLFALGANSGIISVDSTLDRDSSTLKNNAGRCIITVQATEQSGPNTQKGNFTATETVTITVNDVNDNAPTFSGTSFAANITENSPAGTPLQLDRGQQIEATDIDQGSNSEIHLSLLGADDTFELVTSSVQGSGTVHLRVKNSSMLDFEARQLLNVQIAASDNDQSHATATATVRVNIENVNENSPEFANSEYTAAVLEGSVMPGTYLATINATDADAGRYGDVTYMLWNDRGLFRIDSHTGAVTVASNQTDREREDRYYMMVVATDGGNLQQTVPLTVNITDRNDNPPVFQRDQYDVVLREGDTVFSRPLHLEATDADEFNTPNSNVTFSIRQTSPSDLQNHFHLDPVSGNLTVTRALDFDTLNFSSAMAAGVLDLLVVASDRGTPPLWTTATVAVTLIDINCKSPVFQNQLYSTRIPASSTEGTQPALIRRNMEGVKQGEVLQNDQTESRLTLLEAHQTALQNENDALKAENFLLKNSNSHLSDRVHQLEARTSHHVSFHARNLRNTSIQHDSPLIVDHVIINQGNCYSTSTGKFTAPFNGTYFFIGTSGSWATGQTGQFELTAEGQQISFVSTRDNGPLDAASVHGVVHLTQGDTVWLKVSSGIEFWSAATSFSGFLVSPDP